MRKMYFGFIIDGVVAAESGRLSVAGRCCDFPIRVGDEFDRIIRYRPYKLPEEAGRPPVRDAERAVSLRVVCAHAYGRSLPELGEGMTGSTLR